MYVYFKPFSSAPLLPAIPSQYLWRTDARVVASSGAYGKIAYL